MSFEVKSVYLFHFLGLRLGSPHRGCLSAWGDQNATKIVAIGFHIYALCNLLHVSEAETKYC